MSDPVVNENSSPAVWRNIAVINSGGMISSKILNFKLFRCLAFNFLYKNEIYRVVNYEIPELIDARFETICIPE